ncbi:MAG: hypothetical protein V4547_18215 [Bacteroidota bacterium]
MALKKPRKPKEKKVHRTFFIDDAGRNKIFLQSTRKTIVVLLQLETESYKKKIGVVTKSTKTLKIERKRDLHLFRMGNAYGFNEYILKQAKTFDTISLSDELEHWKIPVKFILENGKYLNFAQQGYELQLFVSLSQLEQFRVLKKENRRI